MSPEARDYKAERAHMESLLVDTMQPDEMDDPSFRKGVQRLLERSEDDLFKVQNYVFAIRNDIYPPTNCDRIVARAFGEIALMVLNERVRVLRGLLNPLQLDAESRFWSFSVEK